MSIFKRKFDILAMKMILTMGLLYKESFSMKLNYFMKGSYLFDRWVLLCGRVVSTAFVADVGTVLSSIVLLEEFQRNELYLYKFTFRLFTKEY